MNRRGFLLLLMTSLAGGFAAAGADPALAKDGDGGGKGGGDGGGNSGGDHGGDDGGKGGSDHGDDGDDGDGGSNSSKGKDGDDDDDKDDDRDSSKIRNAVKRGEAASLGKILPAVRRKYPGKVVRIRLTGQGAKLTYRIRLISRDNKLLEVRVDAQSGLIIGIDKV